VSPSCSSAPSSSSNSGYVLLAHVVERVAGQSLNSVMREQFFDPLDMRSAVLRDRPELPSNLALGYAANDGGFEVSIGAWEQVGDGALHLIDGRSAARTGHSSNRSDGCPFS
jgi:CubicO group peptidase (beta-lactamase class C family)